MIKHTLAALLLAGAGSLAMAADTTMSTQSFSDLDANGDGRLTSTEAQGHSQLSQGFRTADANGDGSLSRTEFDTWTASSQSKSSSDSSTPSSSTPEQSDSPSTTNP